MASGYGKSYLYGGPEPFVWLRRLHAYILPWLVGFRLGRWPRYVGNAPELTRQSLIAECRAMYPGVINTLMPDTVAALYDNIALAIIHLSAELGRNFSVMLRADGSISIQRLRGVRKAA